MILGPVDGWVLAGFLLAFAAGTLLVGLPLLRLALKWDLLPEPENPLVSVFLMMGLFSASLPLLVLALSPLRAFGAPAAYAFLALGAGGLVVLWMRSSPLDWRRLLLPGSPNVNLWAPSLLILGGAVLRLAPSIGLYVYPADDPTLYTILTQVLLEDGGATFTLGWLEPFTRPPHPYPYMFGFASLAGFHSLVLTYHPPLSTMLTTLLYSVLLPLGIYSLALRLFNQPVAIASTAMAALVVHFPMDFFTWGGNAETVGYFFAVLAIYLLVPLLRSEAPTPRRRVLLPGLAMASGALVHPFAIAYVVLFLPIPLALAAYRRDGQALSRTALAIGVGLAVLLPVLLAFGLNELTHEAKAAGRFILGDRPSIRAQEVLLAWTGVSLELMAFYLRFLPVALLATAAVFAFDAVRGRSRAGLLLVAGWAGLLFALHENSPYGLYLIPYPLWAAFSTPRFMFALVALPVALALGYAAHRAWKTLVRPGQWKEAVAAFGLAGILLTVSILQVGATYATLQGAEVNSPVVEEDILAFQWIDDNLPDDTWFYVNDADAGAWLYQYTGQPAFPNRMLINDPEVLQDYWRLDALVSRDPGDPEALDLMEKYGIGAVYFGGKPVPVFEDRRQPDLVGFLAYPETYVQVYEDRGVYIFLTDLRDMREFIVDLQDASKVTPKRVVLAGSGATVTLRGPLTVDLELFRGPVDDVGNLVGVETIQIAEDETRTFTLEEHTDEFPGDWNAVVRLVSINR